MSNTHEAKTLLPHHAEDLRRSGLSNETVAAAVRSPAASETELPAGADNPKSATIVDAFERPKGLARISDASEGRAATVSSDAEATGGDNSSTDHGAGSDPIDEVETETAIKDRAAASDNRESDLASLASASDVAGHRVHLASVFNADRVAQEREWSRLRDMYPDLLADLELSIVNIDLGPEKGVYHRIMAGPLDDQTAPALCAELTKRGAWCQAVGQ